VHLAFLDRECSASLGFCPVGEVRGERFGEEVMYAVLTT
jgi:hypothetical protein